MAQLPGVVNKLQPSSLAEKFDPNLLIQFFVLYCVVHATYNYFLHPLRHVPGPFPAKITELWRTRRYMLGNWHQDILDLHKLYGPIVRVSPNEVSIVDKNALVSVFGHGKGTKKTSWYDVWKIPGLSNSLWYQFFNSTDPTEHSFLRKRVSAVYSMSHILSHESEIVNLSNMLWSQLDELAKKSHPVALHDWASFFAFDVVTKLGTDQPVGFVKQGKDVDGIIHSICQGFWESANTGYLPGKTLWFNNPLSRFAQKFVGSGIKPAAFWVWMGSTVQGRLSEKADEERTRDMLDHYISMKEVDGSSASLPSILAEVGNLVGAGADTTSIGIRSVLAQLILHPEDYRRVQNEVDEAARAHNMENMPYTVLDKLPFLNACIKEALRLHPSILWQLPREAPAAGINIAGHFIPSSATISMSPIAQNRDAETFDSDANDWNPHRWLPTETNPDASIKEMDRYNVTFGYGSRTCVGRNLALVEINHFVAEFCQRYDAEFINKEKPFKIISQWFSYQDDMFVRLKLRT
ncbi:hypothetical protein PFICI_07607 [Pestalotiopsis fici W106-1]|uniref:Cytochrome P450 n=1 Tax=Pestalotiopsis fici (strain W106-1 / CGMCC3.15140) TaxID=1229662 RepID=W3X1R5_PESFW|nr:uncharacterized protein PFICI_07607 [Pestalotiopsis fici W106-1]ETS80078.1 hypothetical protein PFICI_07607 [Pestalotiopsis fici W106-1]